MTGERAPGGVREGAALCAFLIALAFAGVYNGPLDELPLLFWCALATVCWAWLTPAGSGDRRAALLAAAALAWCLVAWRASVSPSISLAPTVSLLLLPLAALVALSATRVGPLLAVGGLAGAALVAIGYRDLLAGTLATPTAMLDPNNIATLANLLWPPVIAWLLAGSQPPTRVAVLAGLTVGVAALVLVATGSRAGLLLGGVMVLVLVALALRLGEARVAGALAVAPLLAFALATALGPPPVEDAGIAPSDSAASGLALRALLGAASLELWADAPLTGTGPQTFHLLYPTVRDEAEQLTAGYFAHNDWVQLAQELGVPGAAAVPVLLLWLAVRGARLLRVVLRRAPGARARVGELGLLLAAGSVLLHAAANFTLYVAPIGLLFGVAVGVLARDETPPPVDRARAPRLVGFGLATLLLVPLAIDAVSAAALMGHRGFPGLATQGSPRPDLARTLLTLAPDDSVPPLYLAGLQRMQAAEATDAAGRDYALASAVQYYETALARDPWNTGVHLRYAELATALGGRVPLADGGVRTDVELLEDARRRAPLASGPVIGLGRLYAMRGAVDEERALLADWLRYCRLVQRYEPRAAAVVIERARALEVDAGRLAVCYGDEGA